MVNKTGPEVPKIAKTTRKRKSSRTYPEPANKKRFVEVIEGGLLGFVEITEGEMAGVSGVTEDIELSSDKTANAESASDKRNEKEVNESEKGEEVKKNDREVVTTEVVNVEAGTVSQAVMNEKILSALSKASNERSEMQEFMKVRIEEISATVKRVEEKADEINGIKEDVTAMKNDFKDISKRDSDLENAGDRITKEIKEHLKRVKEEEREQKDLKIQILKEIEHNEKCVVVIGHPFVSMDKAKVLDGLLAAILQDGIPSGNFKEHADITSHESQIRDKT